jgi:hypothetical protein
LGSGKQTQAARILSAALAAVLPPFLKSGALQVASALAAAVLAIHAQMSENARNHLISFQVAQESGPESLVIVQNLNDFSSSLEKLAQGQAHKYSIADPLGTPYQYDFQTGTVQLSPKTKVRYLKIPEIYKNSLPIAAISLNPQPSAR